jgi:hypothetical protein
VGIHQEEQGDLTMDYLGLKKKFSAEKCRYQDVEMRDDVPP